VKQEDEGMSREPTIDELRILCKKLFAGHDQIVTSTYDDQSDKTQELRVVDCEDGSKTFRIFDHVQNMEAMGS
jgi:hypothetical protein